ncbi:uncharacterized protein LOC114531911 [Dendronephthya gigantea]|uniref:uncharacterized protein LOC114531911 n=1 Tax=Dendronephthya gigantea TaxID=151771 RepID=UPI00106CAFF9|nr:uncharacterized protein LOC114531911 [Dendronephthya gigantea]
MSPKSEGKHDEIPKPNDECKNVPNNTNVHVTTPNSNLHAGTGSLVALQTARGVLRGERVVKVRVLFDAGSHRSFVTSKAAGLANPRGIRRELLGINTFGQKCVKAEHREVVELKLEPLNGNKVITLEAFVVPEICSIGNSHVEIARREYKHLEGIWFSDVSKSEDELEVDVLIGADYLWSFQTGTTKRGKSGEPVAIETELGWVLSGPLRVQDIERAEPVQVNFVAQRLSSEDSLESNVQKLWSFEGLGISEEDKVHEEFLDEISFTGSRYSVKLPWKESHKKLPDNYANSLSRMKGQLRRLRKEPALLAEYDSIIRDQVERGIVEPVSALEKVERVHYLPHQAVIRREAVTTKLRIVYDASSKEDAAFVRKLQESFYVDDLVSGESTVEKTFELYDKAKTRMAQGGFRLRKWLTNSEVLRSKLEIHEKDQGSSEQSINDQETYARLSLGAVGGESKGHKVLGQVWDNHKDELKFEISKG